MTDNDSFDESNEQWSKYIREQALSYFGVCTIQTVMFIILCSNHSNDGKLGLASEKIVRKYFLWQSNSAPKNAKLFKDLTFSHSNDLTWLQCVNVEGIYRKTITLLQAESIIPKLVTSEELAKDWFKKDMITNNNPHYDKIEGGYIKNGR